MDSTRPRSWCTNDALPRTRISPASARCTPASTWISVDLPAPFSPSSAWISPARTSKSTPSRAWLAPKALRMPRISRSGPELLGEAPDAGVVLLVAIAREELVLRAALGVDVGFLHDVHGLHEAARRFAVEGAVELVDGLPRLELDRLRQGHDLVLLPVPHAVPGLRRAVGAARPHLRGRNARRAQRRHREVEVVVRHGQHVERPLVPLHVGGHALTHAGRDVGDREVVVLEQRAARAAGECALPARALD